MRQLSCVSAKDSLTQVTLACSLLLADGPMWAFRHTPSHRPDAREVKVLVLNFDPFASRERTQRLRTVLGWNDPRRLAEAYAGDVRRASGGSVVYRIVDWRDLDVFPAKVDGFRYTQETFLACWRGTESCHEPDGADYPALLADYGVMSRIDSGAIDEVWLFGGPYFGFWESAMAGPKAFNINGGVYPEVQSRRPFAVMGFNYERGVAEMLHNLCHRIEATMSHVYGGWDVAQLTTPWARFAANARQSNGVAGAGTCHYPPNAEEEYDYDNSRPVPSSADDWLAYPDLRGRQTMISRSSWGGPDFERRYMIWWFTRLPKAGGTDATGRLNDWWRYVFDLDRAVADGERSQGQSPAPR